MILGHVALYTDDIDKSIEFYKLLGGKPGMRSVLDMGGWSKDLCHMVFDGEATIELIAPSDLSKMPQAKVGITEHFCFNVDDVDATVKEFKAKGIDTFDREAPDTVDIFGRVKLIFLEGPSGEMIELFQQL